MLLLGPLAPWSFQDAVEDTPVLFERAAAARDPVDSWGTRSFEVFQGGRVDERDGRPLTRIDRRDPRGRIMSVLWIDAEGQLVQRSVGARDPLLLRLAVEEEDERAPR